MPRTRWTRRDIEIGVKLRHEGKGFLEIAKLLTEENFKARIPAHLFDTANTVNHERTQGVSLRRTLEIIIERAPELEFMRSEIQDALVSMHRLHYLSKTKRWKDYEATFTQTYNEEIARKVVTH